MSFPYAFHANFETGTKDTFDTESDDGNRLDYPGPKQLLGGTAAIFPHKGAYCMRVNMGKNSTDAYVEEGVSWAADSVNYVRFEFMIGHDFQIGNVGNLVDIVTLISTGPVNEGHVSLALDDPHGMVLGLRDASGAIQGQLEVHQGDWICVELEVSVDAGGGNDGHITLWAGNNRIKLPGLDQAAISAVRFGAMNQTGDFTGHIYFDEVVFDDARLYQDMSPGNLSFAGKTMPFFKSGFAFIGSGAIDGATLIDGGSGDCTLRIFDTDDVNYSESMLKEALSTPVADSVAHSQPVGDVNSLFEVEYGCYVLLAGTAPSALVRIGRSDEDLTVESDDMDDDDV